MPVKITLITPPDIFQNGLDSIMLIDVSTQEQDEIAEWLSKKDSNKQFNVYFFQGESNVPWFLHSLSCSQYRYINLNNMSAITSYLAGYVLSKENVFYKVDDKNISELYSHINNNRISNVVTFLERVFSGTE